MKKTVITAAIVCLLGTSILTTPSCIGSFSLTNRLLGWNNNVGDKFLNELVFFALWVLPVYEVCGAADLLVLNSIEFWSGTNPMAKADRVVDGKDGKYLVRCDDKGYDIISCEDGSKVRFDFDTEEQTWSFESDGERHILFRFVDDTHVQLPVSDGDFRTVEVSQAGVYAYQEMVAGATFASL